MILLGEDDGASAQEDLDPDENQCQQEAMERLVMVALTAAVEGRSGLEFERDVFRAGLLGADIGLSHRSRHFYRQCLYVADLVLNHLDCHEFDSVLDGIGTPGDFTLVCDPVSLGTGWTARHGTVLCMALCLISSSSHKPYSAMLAAPTMGLGDHAGKPMAELAFSAFATHPGQYARKVLRARLCLIGGDGGLTQGWEITCLCLVSGHRHSARIACPFVCLQGRSG